MVAGLEQGVHEQEDGFLGRGDEQIVGVDAVVNGCGFGTQLRMPHRFGVAEFEIEEGFAHLGRGHFE